MNAIQVGVGGLETSLQREFFSAESDETHAKGAFARELKALHAATVTGVGVARVAWEAIPEAAEVIAGLSAAGQAEDDIFDEAERWEIAWEELDPAWVPVPAMTLAALTALIATTRLARRTWLQMNVRRQRAEVRLGRAVHELDRLQKRWYGVATAIFDAESPQGQSIRSQIPTTYVPRYAAAAKRRRKERKAEAAAMEQPPVAPPPAEG